MRLPLFALAATVLLSSCGRPADPAQAVIARTARVMGIDKLRSIQYSGPATEFAFGGSANADDPWPPMTSYTYARVIDFAGPVIYVTAEMSTGPGASRRLRQTIDTASPWRVQMELSLTPWGFVRGALAHHATVAAETIEGAPYRVLSWTAPVKSPAGVPYQFKGFIDDAGLVTRVETQIEDDLFGDLDVEVAYTGYHAVDGVMVPSTVVHRHGGWPRLEHTITAATPNPANLAALIEGAPPAMRPSPPPPAATARAERLADGVYRITGGYVSLAVEFADHVVVIEGGENQARAKAIIAEVRRVIPGKDIRYVVNTHHHFDHSSGLPVFVVNGAAILTHATNVDFVERVLGGPRLLGLDARDEPLTPRVEGVNDVRILEDRSRRVELHHIRGLAHASGMLIAYLPKEKIVVQADMAFIGAFQPGAGEHRTKVLVDNLERLKVDYDSVVFVHAPDPDRPVTKADLVRLVREEK